MRLLVFVFCMLSVSSSFSFQVKNLDSQSATWKQLIISFGSESIHGECQPVIDVNDYIECHYDLGVSKDKVKVEITKNTNAQISSVEVTDIRKLKVRFNTFFDKSYFDYGWDKESYLAGFEQLIDELAPDYMEQEILVTYQGELSESLGLPIAFGEEEYSFKNLLLEKEIQE